MENDKGVGGGEEGGFSHIAPPPIYGCVFLFSLETSVLSLKLILILWRVIQNWLIERVDDPKFLCSFFHVQYCPPIQNILND